MRTHIYAHARAKVLQNDKDEIIDAKCKMKK